MFEQVAGWFGIISAVATILAAVFAAVAIVISARQSRDNTRMIVDERYTDVQLGLLRELIDIVNGSYLTSARSTTGSDGTLRRRAAQARLQIVDAGIPTVRIRYGELDGSELLAALGVAHPSSKNYNDELIGDTEVTVRDKMLRELADATSSVAHGTRREIDRMRECGTKRRRQMEGRDEVQ